MSEYAPVLICTLNRFIHFKNCIESLVKCKHADQTDLYIGLDYPANESHWEGYELINEYLQSIVGFKSLNVIRRETNFGVQKNFDDAFRIVFNNYEYLIVSEDDNVFSGNFLDFINQGLRKFMDDPQIYAVCGYNYPIQMPVNFSSNYYLANAYSGWGCGIWRKKYQNFFQEYMNYDKVISRLNNINECLNSITSTNAFLSIARNGSILGDYAISGGLNLSNMYCVFPSITKVKNNGHDGSGVNCGLLNVDNIFYEQKLDENSDFIFSKAPSKDEIKFVKKMLLKYKGRNNMLLFRCHVYIRYILYLITGKSYYLSNLS